MRESGRIKAAAFWVMAGTLLLALVRPADAHWFEDVDENTHPFTREIVWLKEAGIIDGFEDGTFRPSSRVTRQAFAAYLYRHAGHPPLPPGAPRFPDVSVSHPFRKEIRWLAAEGIASGYDDGSFRPTATVTRQAAAVMLHRYAGSPTVDLNAPNFTDVGPGHRFADAIRWSADVRIAEGYPGSRFRPTAAVTRQAAAAFLYRYDDRDFIKGTLTRASLGVGDVEPQADVDGAGMSDDGRYVTFASQAPNLVPGDTNQSRDVFVRDLVDFETVLVSTGAHGPGDRHSFNPSISGNGRYVVFESYATNLDPNDSTTRGDIYVRDLLLDVTTLVSAGTTGSAGNGNSTSPSVSADGDEVVFSSSSSDLVDEDANDHNDVFVRDLSSGVTSLISVLGEPLAGAGAIEPIIAGDGSRVVFCAETELGVWTRQAVYQSDLEGGPPAEIEEAIACYGGAPPTLSATGRFLVAPTYAALDPADVNGDYDVYRFDLDTSAQTLVSLDSSGHQPEDGWFDAASISADGRYVAFDTYAAFSLHDDDGGVDVYLRDVERGTTSPVSTNSRPDKDGDSIRPSITPDGRFIVFESMIGDLVAGDAGSDYDAFVFERDP